MEEIDSRLNLTSPFEGDAIMKNGDMEIEAKPMSATTFTSNSSDPRATLC